MLARRMVRKPDGSLNAASFEDTAWTPWKQEFRNLPQNHEWSTEQVDDVIRALDGLPEVGALGIWNGYLNREIQTPRFIRYNVHRKIGLAQTHGPQAS